MTKTILILGGTGDARRLADSLVDAFGDQLRVITSFAGRTSSPRRPRGEIRKGGFGGADGLATYIQEHSIDMLIDATHPFATQISEHGAAAAHQAGVPFLMLIRPEWHPEPDDNWVNVPDISSAAQALPGQSKAALITTGVQHLNAFADTPGTRLLIRLIEQPKSDIPFDGAEIIIGKPPYTLDQELALLKLLGVDTIVTKNAGGDATRAKINAARALGIRVIMIDRPPPPDGEQFFDQDKIIARIRVELGL